MLQALACYEDGVSIERLSQKVSALLPLGVNLSPSELRAYLKRGHVELGVSGLVENVPDTDPTEIRLALKRRKAFIEAARRGHTAIVQQLLTEGVGQKTKDAALISSVINDRLEIVGLLLDAGADAHAKDGLLEKDAMMYVTKRTNKEIVGLLSRHLRKFSS